MDMSGTLTFENILESEKIRDTDIEQIIAFIRKVATTMRNKGVNVNDSEIADAISGINATKDQIESIADLKSIMQSTLSKSMATDKVFNEVFDGTLKDNPSSSDAVEDEKTSQPMEDKEIAMIKAPFSAEELNRISRLVQIMSKKELTKDALLRMLSTMPDTRQKTMGVLTFRNRNKVVEEIRNMSPDQRKEYFKTKGV